MNRCEEALVHLHALEEMASKKSATVVDDVDNKGGLASAPTSAKARAALCVNLASIRIQQNELELAEKSLRQALLFSPSSMDALRGLVYLHLRQGQSKHAMQILQERRLCIISPPDFEAPLLCFSGSRRHGGGPARSAFR